MISWKRWTLPEVAGFEMLEGHMKLQKLNKEILEGENRMEIKDVVGWIVALVVAIIGVSSIVIKRNQKISNRNMKNTMNQTITNGDNNVQAGGDVNRNV